ncbi:hypothetical protein C0J52_09416 [Blattella germanica]|nr:hypothetical protein C0J52_09416 [Blattella germanica]
MIVVVQIDKKLKRKSTGESLTLECRKESCIEYWETVLSICHTASIATCQILATAALRQLFRS